MELQSLVLHEFELPKAFPWTIYSSPSFLNCFGDQKAIKTPKLNTIWLELIARVLNMLIELKGNNYYSKVFKRINYKLQNSTFWVVIRFHYCFKNNSTKHITVVCTVNECSWKVTARAIGESNIVQVHTFQNRHNHSLEDVAACQPLVRSNRASLFIDDVIRSTPDYQPCQICKDFQRQQLSTNWIQFFIFISPLNWFL